MAEKSRSGGGYYGGYFERPGDLIKVRKVSRKRALQSRLETPSISSSPSKRSRETDNNGIISTAHVPEEDDDSLMSFFYSKSNPPTATAAPSAGPSLLTALQFSASAPSVSPSSKRRQALTPAPPHLTPSPSRQPPRKLLNKSSTSARKLFPPGTASETIAEAPVVSWSSSLPLDWSLKTKVTFTSIGNPFPWRSTLGAAEESTGTSAFVRCTPEDSGLLGTSWGARLRSATLYWTHPALPIASPLFPPGTHGRELDGIRLEERITNGLWEEWTESFGSLFHLVRSRQAPFFYVTPPAQGGLTLFFAAAGTQGLSHLQVYVTPSSKGFREALTQEGIEFTMPYYQEQDSINGDSRTQKDDSDEEENTEDWLDEMGITSTLSISSSSILKSQSNAHEEKKKSSLIMIVGTQAALLFFNFLLNSKTFLVPSSGPYKGIPPTLLSPVAFVGASLKALQVRHSKTRLSGGNKAVSSDPTTLTTKHTLEITGPILPSVLVDLTMLLSPVISEFTWIADVCMATSNFNVSQEDSGHQRNTENTGSSAFELQNLSDCGLKRSLLEHFCSSPSASSPYTIIRQVVARNGMFHINPYLSNRSSIQKTNLNAMGLTKNPVFR